MKQVGENTEGGSIATKYLSLGERFLPAIGVAM